MEKHTMTLRACPHIGGKKCVGAKCAAWDEGPITEKTQAGPVDRWAAGCVLFFWGPIWQREACSRLHGTQSGIESMRNNEARAFGSLARMLQGPEYGDQSKAVKRISRALAD